MVVEGGAAATFRASEGGIAAMDEPDVDVMFLGVE
jgi:hypothetical protein